MKVDVRATTVNLAELVERARGGEEVTILRDGEPVARLVPIRSARQPGSARGKLRLRRDFFEPLPIDVVDRFEKS
jgi:prevent-host-death family protein